MKFFNIFFCIYLFLSWSLKAQNKQITLSDIWNGTFKTERLDALHSMRDGQRYSILNYDRNLQSTTIDIYNYKTLKKISTIVSSSDIEELKYFTDYTFSKDESKILLATETEAIYRRSTLGYYYVFNTDNASVTQVYAEKIQEPTFSPDGSKVAFAYNNNLYITDLESSVTQQITFDGKKNQIINGITDWVYEEEFSIVRAFDWNKSSNKIAFIKFDEAHVPEFSMDVYGAALYQNQQVFKYPKAGEKNSKVSLHIYDVVTRKIKNLKTTKDYKDFYIPRIKWTNKTNILSAQYINRTQNKLDLWLFNTEHNTATLTLEETDEAYIDIHDNLTFLNDNSFIWTSEKDGFNHIYYYDAKGKLKHQVTQGNWEVTDYYGFNKKKNTVYYQSTENGSINRNIYSIKLNGRNKTNLTKQNGTNSAAFSTDFTYFINTFSNALTPPVYTLNNADSGKIIKTIANNNVLAQKLSSYKLSKKEFSTLSVNGNNLNMWMLKPLNFDATKVYPLLITQYSGPGSQSVSNNWNSTNDYWYQMLAQQGYIVVCVDGRGTGYKGAAFKKITQHDLGKYEVEDQIQAAKQIGSLPYIDSSRIGIWGWSYGGFMSSNCLFKGNNVFKMAIAVAPVTSWRFYDTIYTERYLGLPQNNAAGYDNNSPINHVEKLKGNFLLVHGSADDNVHVQNTMRLVEALVQANKQFDWAIYPDKNHGIYGGNTRMHLYTKMTNFIKTHLGDKLN